MNFSTAAYTPTMFVYKCRGTQEVWELRVSLQQALFTLARCYWPHCYLFALPGSLSSQIESLVGVCTTELVSTPMSGIWKHARSGCKADGSTHRSSAGCSLVRGIHARCVLSSVSRANVLFLLTGSIALYQHPTVVGVWKEETYISLMMFHGARECKRFGIISWSCFYVFWEFKSWELRLLCFCILQVWIQNWRRGAPIYLFPPRIGSVP